MGVEDVGLQRGTGNFWEVRSNLYLDGSGYMDLYNCQNSVLHRINNIFSNVPQLTFPTSCQHLFFQDSQEDNNLFGRWLPSSLGITVLALQIEYDASADLCLDVHPLTLLSNAGDIHSCLSE